MKYAFNILIPVVTFFCVANGDYSTALGNLTAASGDSSIALGVFTKAQNYATLAMGVGISNSNDVFVNADLEVNQKLERDNAALRKKLREINPI